MKTKIRWTCAMLLASVLAGGHSALAHDLALVDANMGRTSCVPNAETVLSPVLVITPPRKTILPGETITFSAAGSTNPITWFYLDDASAGSLAALSSTTALYTAGSVTSAIDVVEAWDGFNMFGRAYLNVIGQSEVGALGKTIIVAGGKNLADPVWEATDYIADKAYRTLRYRGFSAANIQYVSFGPPEDLDDDGIEDVDAYSSLAGTALAFTNWAPPAHKLLVYLADHGSDAAGQGYFRLNDTEILSAATLDGWLDQIQNTYTTEVTVVMDFCYAGSFLDELAYTGAARRIVISATADNQLTYFIAGGLVSFSDLFWSGVLQGMDLDRSFRLARESMSAYQQAQLDDDGDGSFTGSDGAASTGRHIGATFVAGKGFPIIGTVLGSQLLGGSSKATLYADDIASYYPIDRVWCTIIPPSHNPNTNSGIPVVDIAEVDLPYNAIHGRYQGEFDGFTENGTYRINYYAKDVWQSVSPPRHSQVIQSGYADRLLIVAGGPAQDPQWPAFRSMASVVFNAALARAFNTNTIYFLSGESTFDANHDGTNDVTALSDLSNLVFAVTNWAAGTNVLQRLTLFLVGQATNGEFRLNDHETLSAASLDALLDQHVQSSNVAVQIIMEFPGSGGWLPQLLPPPNRERINIASAKAGQATLWNNEGTISFSQYLFSRIAQGIDLDVAYKKAKSAIRLMSGALRQAAQMDDDGDGIPDEKSQDGLVAATRRFGSAFVTGDDKPSIGGVSPDIFAPTNHEALVWARDIVDVDGISNAWCIITPPDARSTADLIRVDLAYNPAATRFEAPVALPKAGRYALTFYAQDNQGEMADAVQSIVSSADAYEEDDTLDAASYTDAGDTQLGHNFDAEGDEDWVRFYAVSGQVYQVDVEQQGTNIDLKLDLWWERPDASFTNIDPDVDLEAEGVGLLESTGMNLSNNAVWGEGFYYLRVSPANSSMWGVDSDYDVSVTVPVGGGHLVVVAVDRLNPAQSPPDAVVTVDGGSPQSFNGRTSVSYTELPAGSHTIQVTAAAGYLPSQDPALPDQPANPVNALYGNPKNKLVVDDAWQSVVFQFVPHLRAQGEAKDAWTGEMIADAKIEFTARSGLISNIVYDGYPNNASYESLWYTRADGSFPTNVLLPAVNYDLTLSKAGYSNLVQADSIMAPAPAATNELGHKLLTPVDANGNGIADTWENLYFDGPTGATNDPDDDGQSNQEEYWTGTNPTNAGSLFRNDELDATNGVTLHWPVTPGRVYRVLSTSSLITDHWSLSAGPWTAAVGQASMQWTDGSASTGLYYRIQAYTR